MLEVAADSSARKPGLESSSRRKGLPTHCSVGSSCLQRSYLHLLSKPKPSFSGGQRGKRAPHAELPPAGGEEFGVGGGEKSGGSSSTSEPATRLGIRASLRPLLAPRRMGLGAGKQEALI